MRVCACGDIGTRVRATGWTIYLQIDRHRAPLPTMARARAASLRNDYTSGRGATREK
jgi:ribosomal protein S12 methylthiotransferase accessory factor YcaO